MDWQTARNDFIRQVGGDIPGATLEAELIHAYAEHPDAVTRSLEKIALGHQAGKIRSPWGALKAEVAKAIDAANNPTHTQATHREHSIQRAEQRIRNELSHYEWDEAEDELFGERGTLRHHDTPDTRARMHTIWNTHRPVAEAIETDQATRLERIRQQKIAANVRPTALHSPT